MTKRDTEAGDDARGIDMIKVATVLAILLLASMAFSVAFIVTRSTFDEGSEPGETQTTEEKKEQDSPSQDDGEGGEAPVGDDGKGAPEASQPVDEDQGFSEEREAEDTERIASGQADDGTYVLSGTVRVHEELFVPMSRIDRVASLVLDEGMPYESEYKGTVYDLVAHDVLLATTGSESFGADRFDEWAQYDGRHVVVKCERIGEALRDGSYWGTDTLASGEMHLLEADE